LIATTASGGHIEWKELWGVEIESSNSVALRISVSQWEDAATKRLSIRKRIRRADESYPTKDGFALQVTPEALNRLIRALEAAKDLRERKRATTDIINFLSRCGVKALAVAYDVF